MIAAVAAACVPPGVSTVVGGTCAMCAVFDKKAEVPAAAKAVSPGTRAADVVALAANLADHGYSTNSPLSLLTAAELLMQASPTALSGKRGITMPAVTAKSGAAVTFEPGAMIAAARSMAGGNTGVAALATQLQNRLASGPKGAVGGPRSTVDRVLSNSTDIWEIRFRGGERGSIRVGGDGDTDLDCYVYNSAGTLVAYDNDLTDYCILDWYQASTGNIRLEIRNLGDVYNEYILSTN
ncbi:MAG: hypothetical protein WD553_04580 [Gemmatimonadaceae bacterium]